jgi:hypothetical protein
MTAPSRRPLLGLVAVALLAAPAPPQPPAEQLPPPRPTNPTRTARPRMEAVAETKLLMEGLLQANFRGLERNLAEKPAEAAAWGFARGQALLIAEGGNLLMLRPPRGSGQDQWFERATELRESAARLARQAAGQNYDGSRAALVGVAEACNRCHQAFRVDVAVRAFAEPKP